MIGYTRQSLVLNCIKQEREDPIKRLKGASAIQDKLKREREMAEKALKLNSLFS